MVDIGKQRCFKARAAWRAWLRAHHATEAELWLIFYKKHTGKATLVYDEAVEEALCFGWIDGIRKRMDDEKHTIRFTPRRKSSVWSPTNKQRVAKMIAAGKMTEAGLALIHEAQRNGQWEKAEAQRSVSELPSELKQALARNEKAGRFFATLAPSYRKQFIGWIASAKRAETRRKRASEAVGLLAENKKLGMK